MDPFYAYLIVGIIIVLIGIFTIHKGSKQKSRCTATTSAVIVEIQQGTDSENSVTYTPVYEFTVGQTTVRKSGGRYSYNKKEYHVGGTALVRYNPDNPQEFLVDGKSGAKGAGFVLLLFGLVIIAISFTQR